jgi:prophage maintenance system killer protein
MSSSFLSDVVEREYHRWVEEIGDFDPYASASTLGIHEVLRAHFLLGDFFTEEGNGFGGLGPRSLDLLHSALARQFAGFGGRPLWTSKLDVCATLFYGLIKNHAFHDANKRTAFLSLLFHLEKFDTCPSISQRELEDFAVDVADNALEKFSRFRDMKKANEENVEVRFIGDYLRRNTRR